MGLTKKQREMKAAKAATRAAAAHAQAEVQAEAQAQAEAKACLADPERRATIETAALLAWCLGEREYGPRLQLLRSVRVLGPDLAREMLAEALHIDAEGGELVASRSRYRTPGGIYFRLVRDLLSPEEWARVVVTPWPGVKGAAA